MIAARSTYLKLDAERTTLATGQANEVVLTVGVQSIADGFFRHEPPIASEIERAIDAVEDAITSSHPRHAERGELVTDEPLLQAWVFASHPKDIDTRLSRDEVEAIFQRLALASFGHPAAWVGLPTGRAAAAAILILRECMHHLSFDGIRILSTKST